MRAVVMVAALGSVAHADPVTDAERAGWINAELLARGKVSVVDASDRVLLVDGKGRVAETEEALAGIEHGKVSVKVTAFLGDRTLEDVLVRSQLSEGAEGSDAKMHYVVRTKTFEIVCTFGGGRIDADENGVDRAPVTIRRTRRHPLAWDVIGEGDDVEHYTIGAEGPCATSE